MSKQNLDSSKLLRSLQLLHEQLLLMDAPKTEYISAIRVEKCQFSNLEIFILMLCLI